MTSSTLTRRTAASGAAGLVALGGLAVGLVSPADATTAPPTVYSCNAAALPSPMKASVVGKIKLPTRVKAGQSLAGIPITMLVTLNGDQIRGLATALGFTKLGGSVSNAALQVTKPGVKRSLPLTRLAIKSKPVPSTGNMHLAATGKTKKTARAPKPVGKYTVRMPKGFTFDPKSDATIQTGPLTCTLVGKAGSFGTMTVHR